MVDMKIKVKTFYQEDGQWKMGIGKARNCYSPDFSAKDWDDAMKDLLKRNY